MIDPVLQRAFEHMRAGRLEVALASVQDLLRNRPGDHNAAQMLALLLVQSGRHEEALPHLAAAVAAEPRAPQYRNNYANTLLHLKRYKAAAEQWERAVALDPKYALGWLGLACVKPFLDDSAGARKAAEKGLALRPGWPQMTSQLVLALEAAGELDAAVDVCERALAADPNQPALRSRYLMLLNYRCEEPSRLFAAHQDYGAIHGRPLNPPRTDGSPDRPLRLGILSGDLRTHSVAFFVEPLLRHLPAWATLTVFASAATPDDPMTRRFRELAANWIEVGAMDDAALNHAIRAQGIDVLLELHGHSGATRLAALADKPAPVIITAVGYPNTTGLPSIDWRLVDSITDPPASESLATERLLRLDPCFLCYSPPTDAPEPILPPSSVPITFASFNSLSKISDTTIALWARVLAAVPSSRILLKTRGLSDPAAKVNLRARLIAAGITKKRIEMIPYATSIPQHLAVYSRVHIALDTTPYNGTTTTCEALWMGVPVVCLLGTRHAARVSSSLVTAAGHPEFVAQSHDEYVDIATRLATDTAALHELRTSLRELMRRSPLVDDAGYAERFYTAVRSCWIEYCTSAAR